MTDQPVTQEWSGPLLIGVDVGSTTVKAVVLNPDTMEIMWSDYQRHNTKQPEKTLELLDALFHAGDRDCQVLCLKMYAHLK